jgi:hypothetical protein
MPLEAALSHAAGKYWWRYGLGWARIDKLDRAVPWELIIIMSFILNYIAH